MKQVADGQILIDTKIDLKGAEKGISDLKIRLEDTAKKAESIGKNMSKYITAPLMALGGVAFAAANDIDNAYNTIAVGTGAVGEDLEALKDTFIDVFQSVPDSADAASTALANLNTFTGATGETLADLTKNVLDASRTLGEDGVANSEAFGKAMAQWQIPAQDGVRELDKLYKLTQDYGVSLGQISGHLTGYGAVLKNAGFEMDEAARFFAILESQGLSVSRIMPALNASFRNWAAEGKNSREELQRVIDVIRDTEDSQEALALATEVFGAQGAQRLMTAIRNDAIPALDELGDYFEGTAGVIQFTSDETKTVGDRLAELKNQAQVGLEPLGVILVDLAQEILPPLIEQVTKFAEWMRNLDPRVLQIAVAIGAVVAAIGPLFLGIKGLIGIITTIMPIIKALGVVIGALTSPVGLVVAAIVGLATLIFFYWEEIREFTKKIWNWITDFLTEWGTTILVIIGGPVAWIVSLVIEYWDEIKDFTMKVFNAIAEFFSNIWESIKNTVMAVLNWYVEKVTENWNMIKEITLEVFEAIADFFTNIWSKIQTIFRNTVNKIREVLSSVWDTIKQVTMQVFNSIASFFDDAWSRILANLDKFKDRFVSIWEAIKDGVRMIVNAIIGIANALIGGIENMINAVAKAINRMPSFSIPNWVPGIGGKSFSFPKIPTVDLPKIPSLDVGTNFVERDGLAFLHRGEAVVPKKYNPAAGGVGGHTFNINVYAQDGTDAGHKIAAVLRRMKI